VFTIYHAHYNIEFWEGDRGVGGFQPLDAMMQTGEMSELASHSSYSARIDLGGLPYPELKAPMLQLWVDYYPWPFRSFGIQSGQRFFALPDSSGTYQWHYAGQASHFRPEGRPFLNP
jgi:hypothetical protein